MRVYVYGVERVSVIKIMSSQDLNLGVGRNVVPSDNNISLKMLKLGVSTHTLFFSLLTNHLITLFIWDRNIKCVDGNFYK